MPDWLTCINEHAGQLDAASLPRQILAFVPGRGQWPMAAEMAGKRPPSAIAMLFIPPESGEGDARLVLTRRSTSVRSHKGQVAFAGGRREPEEISPAETAQREVEEELGVHGHHIVPLGTLPPLTALDGTMVVPVVCWAKLTPQDFNPNLAEVAYAFCVPWRRLTRANAIPFKFNLFGDWRRSLRFAIGAESIWGLTAQMIFGADLA